MIKMPSAFQVSECVRRLTRRESEVTVLAKPSATVKLPYGGTFHGGDRAVVAMCAGDLAFAAFTGAALSLIPAESAHERIATGALDEMLEENFAEVLNVLARIYVVPESARMTLLETVFPPRVVPATLEGVAPGVAVLRADYRIDIDGYGTGHLALWGAGVSRAGAAPGTDADASADDVGVLVRSCAQATLAHIDASVDELGRAGALLGDAMAVLRERFAAALAAGTGAEGAEAGECRRHLEAAMVALQCEDALVQMLESLRRRSLRAAEALRGAVAPGPCAAGRAAVPGDERAAREATASRLRQAVTALNADAARAGPVRQQRAVVGTVELF